MMTFWCSLPVKKTNKKYIKLLQGTYKKKFKNYNPNTKNLLIKIIKPIARDITTNY